MMISWPNHSDCSQMYGTEVDELRSELLDVFGPLYERADEEVTPTAELFYVVDVGTPSETETQQLYRNAATDVFVITTVSRTSTMWNRR